MTALVANFVGMTVSGTPGTGSITLGSTIAPGSISFATAYGQDTTVDLTYVDGVNRACETGCIYNHASNTITRGYNETSTTGSVLSLTPNALIFVSWPASKVNAFNQMFVNVGTNEIPIWELEANIIPRTDTLANLSVLTSGGGELCSATDGDAIVQLQGTPGSGTVKYYSPMYPGTYAPAGQGSSTVFIPNHPWISTGSTHNFTIGSTYSSNTVKGGRLTVRGGNNTSTGNGGDVYLSGGAAGSSGTASSGGTINITTTNGYGTGKAGNILIQAGSNSTPVNGEGYVRIRANGSTLIEAGPVYNTLGFYNADPITKPAVVGPITGEGALTSLLTGLSNLGLVNITGVTTGFKRLISTFGQPNLLPIPVRTTPYMITGITRYVDPTWGGPYNGTFAQPYNSPTQATLAAGDGLLFKIGTTTTIIAHIAPAVTGTSNAPIVFGVYDGSTGRRVLNRLGAATIDCGGAAIHGFYAGDRSYICVDGLAFQNNSGAYELIKMYGSNSACQVLNCKTLNGGTTSDILFNTSGSGGHVIEGCHSDGASASGIQFQISSNDSTSRIQFNRVTNATNFSIMVYDGYSESRFTFSGHVACNSCEDSATSYQGGINFTIAGGAFKCYRNSVHRCVNGIGVVSSLYYSTIAGNFSGALIQNNDVSNCEFNISVGAMFGSWSIEYNRVSDAGSYTGSTWVTSNRYGRNIELFGGTNYADYNAATTYADYDPQNPTLNRVRFGPDLMIYESLQAGNTGNAPDAPGSTWWTLLGPSANVRDGEVRFNYCTGAYNWTGSAGAEGTEGTGIGIDNNTMNVRVYGNYCEGNEGTGIQVNSVISGIAIFGNLCVDNSRVRDSHSVTIPDLMKSEIFFVYSPYIEVYNNTCVSFGRVDQKYSISESNSYPSIAAKVYNNLLIGATTAGLVRNTSVGASTEYHNIIVDAPIAVIDTNGTTIANGTGTSIQTTVGAVAGLYKPAIGSACDGTGADVPGCTVSLDGQPLSYNPPIGALYPE